MSTYYELLGLAPEIRENVANPSDRHGEEALALVDTLAEPGDLRHAGELLERTVADVSDE